MHSYRLEIKVSVERKKNILTLHIKAAFALRARAHSPSPQPQPASQPGFATPRPGARIKVQTRVFAILHLCPCQKRAILRFYTYIQTKNNYENAFSRFYTYVRTKNSRICDSTRMSEPKTRDFAIIHFCPHMDAASAHLDTTLTHMDFHDLAKHRAPRLTKLKTKQKTTFQTLIQ